MNKKSIPGWTINIEEISNGVFKVTLTDAFGRKAEIIDTATDETIERAIADAFDIERQISKNWNLFLYDLVIHKLVDTDIAKKEYDDKAFGSWCIERQNRRLVYDGKDAWLIFQTKSKKDWMDIDIIKNDELTYSSFIAEINKLTENTSPNSFSSKAGRSWWQKLFGSK